MSQKSIDVDMPATNSTDSYLTTPSDYIVEIHEIGLANTNPIIGSGNSRTWDENNCIKIYKKRPILLNVAPNSISKNIKIDYPPLGKYNFNYVLIKKTIQIKASATFKNGPNFYSQKDGNSLQNNIVGEHSVFSENIVNFNFNTEAWDTKVSGQSPVVGSSSYFSGTGMEGLLLKSDKKTLSDSNNSTEYILAVYDSTSNPIDVKKKGGINIKFTASNSIQINPMTNWGDVITFYKNLVNNSLVSAASGKYLFNGETTENVKYVLNNGTYILKNIPYNHPIALLNKNINLGEKLKDISYNLLQTNPIIIKVGPGSQNPGNNVDTFEFKNDKDEIIYLTTTTQPLFRFMRGSIYRFVLNDATSGNGSTHPFQITVGDIVKSFTGNVVGESFDILFPKDKNETDLANKLKYECLIHSNMTRIIKLSIGNVLNISSGNATDAVGDGGENHQTEDYDFYYGDVEVKVHGDFGKVSIFCLYHGYMGGRYLFYHENEKNKDDKKIVFNALPPKFISQSK